LIAKIRAAAQSRKLPGRAEPPANVRRAKLTQRPRTAPAKVIAIGISTGGPNALQCVLSQLPPDFAGVVLVVQHMPEGFTELFARRLDDVCALEVKHAQSGDLLLGGRVLICPGNLHMKIRNMPLGQVVALSDEPRVNGHRPSVDVLFRSLGRQCGRNAIAVLMTGMGDDGAEGLRAVKDAGGLTIAQSEDSCVVYGMPKAAIERGYAMRVVPLDSLAHTLMAQCVAERPRTVNA
jgi:two-component system chemotaxis response regulator CheB